MAEQLNWTELKGYIIRDIFQEYVGVYKGEMQEEFQRKHHEGTTEAEVSLCNS